MNQRIISQIQHGITYPSGHLDRYASFGPAFEMSDHRAPDGDQPRGGRELEPVKIEQIVSESAQFDAKRFILGGNATFTLQGLQTRYTYNVRRSEPDNSGRSVLFISLLTGPDNQSDYSYLGLIRELDGGIQLTRKSRLGIDSGPIKAFNWASARIWRGVDITPARLFHEGKCGRCGRALTVPASIESGFGPECLAKLNGGE